MASDAFGAKEIAIYDMMGRKVFAQTYVMLQGYNELVLQPDLKAGVYVLKLGHSTHKIIRQ